jgi:hypothetical protein
MPTNGEDTPPVTINLDLAMLNETQLRELTLQSLSVLALKEERSLLDLVQELGDEIEQYQEQIEEEAEEN